MIDAVHFSSQTCLWSTPQNLFDQLNGEFGFTIDVCANSENAKCPVFFSPDDDGLLQPWHKILNGAAGGGQNICWMNPPYGNRISDWMEKAYRESFNGVTTVCLLPARTDTRWFHQWILGKAEIRFVKGRLHFNGSKHPAPFPSMIVIYRAR